MQASASQAQVKQYQFTDVKPLNGANYYRLKQVDKDGQVHYSAVIKINFAGGALWQLYPNPAGSNTALYAQGNLNKLQIVLTDISGKMLYQNNSLTTVVPGQKINIPVQNLSRGIYILKVISNEGSSSEKLVIQ